MGEVKAVIDIGSNSVLLLLARRNANGELEVLEDISTVTRLSEGVGQSGQLSSEAIGRTLKILKSYRSMITNSAASLQAVTTEAVRLASNSSDFLQPASEVLGTPVQLLSGEDEARLSYLSVAKEMPGAEALCVLDIGGGSSELVWGRGEDVKGLKSHPIGSVRLTEAHIHNDPPQLKQIQAVEQVAKAAFEAQPLPQVSELIGLAGTVTTCAALLLGLQRYERNKVDGSCFSMEQLIELRDRLAQMNNEQRRALPALGIGRADVIVCGATILIAAMKRCQTEQLRVRDRGLRYALI